MGDHHEVDPEPPLAGKGMTDLLATAFGRLTGPVFG
jgi:hypothetical protein